MRLLPCTLVAFGLVSSAGAATFQPTRFDDPAPDGCLPTDCSLREAVIDANATVASDDIVLAAGDYELQRLCSTDTPECGDLDVTAATRITGAGSAATHITNATDPPFDVVQLYQARVLHVVSASLELDALTLRRGIGNSSFFGDVPGGCLRAQAASLALHDVAMTDCYTSSYGGAAYLTASQGTFDHVLLTRSRASGGGGIVLGSNTTVSGSRVRILDNTAYWGGGVLAWSGPNALRLADRSFIAGNSTVQDNGDQRGGGVLVLGPGTLTLDSDHDDARHWLRIEGNEAGTDGGGVAVGTGAVLELSEVRVLDNLARVSGGGVQSLGIVRLRDAEIARNFAEVDGGGVALPVTGEAGSRLERLSVYSNVARGNGGGIASSAPRVWIENVSSHANEAIGTGGGFHIGAIPRGFRFNTSYRDRGAGGSTVHAGDTMEVRGNVFAGRCSGPGPIINLGNNVRSTTATGCPGTTMSSVQMGLSFGDWAGPFELVGFAPSSLLAGFVPSSAGPPLLDARARTRLGPSYDAGAYEHDAL
jgi:hypothetical protein